MADFTTIVTVGHVDHGKSSVIGRMLYDAHAIPDAKVQAVKAACARSARPFEYAYLLDSLKVEQAQGITLDVARYTFSYEGKRYEILDAPGHLELLKNMVTGASRADAAVLVVDANRGVEANTKQHAFYLKMLHVAQILVAVNKMDLIDYDEAVYRRICGEIDALFASLGLAAPTCIPTSAYGGDNIVFGSANMPWYEGTTLLGQLSLFRTSRVAADAVLRLPVQDVYRFGEDGDERRIIAGTIASGRLAVGDAIKFLPSGKRTYVKSIESLSSPKTSAAAGEAVGFTATEELVLFRGETAVAADDDSLMPVVCAEANVFWLGTHPLIRGKEYIFKQQTLRSVVRVAEVESVFDAAALQSVRRDEVHTNEVATVALRFESPVVFDETADSEMNRFVLVDDYEIAGGGLLSAKQNDLAYDDKHLKRTKSNLSPREREYYHLRTGAVVWLSGISGSGKSTIATGVCRELARMGVNAYVLDGDELRSGLNADLDFSPEGRTANVLRTAHVARILKQAGVVALVTLISPYRHAREEAKRIVGDGFVGVYVKASPEACRARDPKRLYQAENTGQLAGFSAHVAAYEPPQSPDLTVDTERLSEMESVREVLNYIVDKLL